MPPRNTPWPPLLHHEATAVTEDVAAEELGRQPCISASFGDSGSCSASRPLLPAPTSSARRPSHHHRQPAYHYHQDEEPDSDGALGPADELEDESGTDNDEGSAQGLTRPGKRTFNALALHPNGVENWMHEPNCRACLLYSCFCLEPCLLKVQAHHIHCGVTAMASQPLVFERRPPSCVQSS